MSLLSATQGTPERVWSLLGVLSAHGGQLPRQEVVRWLDPDEKYETAADQTLQAASGLGLTETQGGVLSLSLPKLPSTVRDFSDLIHERLTLLPDGHADRIMLEVMAWMVVSIERQGSTLWLQDNTAAQLADQVDAGLPPLHQEPGERRFNSTKYAPWKRWIQFLGLGFDSNLIDFYPAVAQRLKRELMIWDSGAEIEAAPFLARLAQRMPYVDNGRLFEATADRLNLPRTPLRLTRVLSAALRELHDDHVLELKTVGDAPGAIVLASDSHSVKTFLSVRIGGLMV